MTWLIVNYWNIDLVCALLRLCWDMTNKAIHIDVILINGMVWDFDIIMCFFFFNLSKKSRMLRNTIWWILYFWLLEFAMEFVETSKVQFLDCDILLCIQVYMFVCLFKKESFLYRSVFILRINLHTVV